MTVVPFTFRCPFDDGCCAQAPAPIDPLRVGREKCKAPEVPRVLLPIAPLGPIELPQLDSFEPTSPLLPVGRSDGEDGGIPRCVERRTAAVIPPFWLKSACTERIAKAVWTCVGESKGSYIVLCRVFRRLCTQIEEHMNSKATFSAAATLPRSMSPKSWYLMRHGLPKGATLKPSHRLAERLRARPLLADIFRSADPVPALGPPQQIIVTATTHPSSSTELVNGAFTDFPCDEVTHSATSCSPMQPCPSHAPKPSSSHPANPCSYQ